MKIKNYILIGVIIFAAIIVGYSIYQNISNPLTTTNIQSTQNTAPVQDIIVDEKDKNCTFNIDCTVIYTRCGDCGLDVVNKAYTKKYDSKLKQVCEDRYPKIACDIDYRDTHEIKCIDSRCKLVPRQ